jgi:hypothetical protein
MNCKFLEIWVFFFADDTDICLWYLQTLLSIRSTERFRYIFCHPQYFVCIVISGSCVINKFYKIMIFRKRSERCTNVQSSSCRGVLDATLCDKVCQWLAAGRWFSPGIPVSSTNKTDRHDIAKILLKVALNTITLILM